jgi:hypothetical protein
MEIRFHDPDETPLPPQETRISALQVEPWPDGHRIAVDVQITPFQQRPNLHVLIYDEQGEEVASVAAMQILQRRLGFTLYLRSADTRGRYTVEAHLGYPDPDLNLGVVDSVKRSFVIP